MYRGQVTTSTPPSSQSGEALTNCTTMKDQCTPVRMANRLNMLVSRWRMTPLVRFHACRSGVVTHLTCSDEELPSLNGTNVRVTSITDGPRWGNSAHGRSRAHEWGAQRRHNLSSFAYHDAQSGHASSSPASQQGLSSPIPRAARRPTAVSTHEQPGAMHYMPSVEYDNSHRHHHPPSYVEQLEAEEQTRQVTPVQQVIDAHPQDLQEPSVHGLQGRHRSGAPVVRGVSLVSTREMPDSFRSLFNFPFFNAMQSECFATIYQSNNNFVLSSPTGSGKTAILELAICRLINTSTNGSYKIRP
nr:atp-dependent dna helicase mer3 [Quercus suber]